jgi:HEPN domain-containing protein
MEPQTSEGWIEVANERMTDAAEMFSARSLSIGPVYMAGYAVECSLKAYLQHMGIPRPPHGPGGHDLRGLWRSSGLSLSELGDRKGEKAFYLKDWSTDLRYEVRPDLSCPAEELIQGAKELTGWLQTRMRRHNRRRR